MDGDAFFGDQQVLAHESTLFAKVHGLAVEAKGFIREFAAQGSIGEEVADPSFEVYPAICAGSAGPVAHPIKLFQVFAEVEGEGPKHPATLRKCHTAQGRVACCPGIVQDSAKIQAFRTGVADQLAGKGIIQGLAVSVSFDPLAGDIVSQLRHRIQSFKAAKLNKVRVFRMARQGAILTGWKDWSIF